MTIEEAREKLRELTALVESPRNQAMLHPNDRDVQAAWREPRRDLDIATAAIANMLGHHEIAARLKRRSKPKRDLMHDYPADRGGNREAQRALGSGSGEVKTEIPVKYAFSSISRVDYSAHNAHLPKRR